MTESSLPELSPDALGSALREAVEFVDAEGWGQPPTLFALVPTALVAQTQPDLADTLDTSELTLIAQEALPVGEDNSIAELEHLLGTTSWPPGVAGAALVQEIIVLPPDAEDDLDDAFEPLLADPDAADAAAVSAARAHPDSKVARLAAGALRDGQTLTLMQLQPEPGEDPYQPIELLSHPDLAPNLVHALAATLDEDLDPDEY